MFVNILACIFIRTAYAVSIQKRVKTFDGYSPDGVSGCSNTQGA